MALKYTDAQSVELFEFAKRKAELELDLLELAKREGKVRLKKARIELREARSRQRDSKARTTKNDVPMLEKSAQLQFENKTEAQDTEHDDRTAPDDEPYTELPSNPYIPAIAFPGNTTTSAAILPSTAETLPPPLPNVHTVELVPTPKIDWAIEAQDAAPVEVERPAALLAFRAQTSVMRDNREAATARKKAEAEQEAKEARERKERLRIKMKILGLDKSGQPGDVSGSFGDKKRKRAKIEAGEDTPAQKHTKF